MKNILLFIILAIVVIPSYAEIKTYTQSSKKIIGSNQSIDDVKLAAVADAKREIIEKAGTYIESLTIVKDGTLEKDEISALALGMLKTEILSEKKWLEGDSLYLEVTIKAQVDTKIIEDKAYSFKTDKSSLEQYKEMQKNMDMLLAKFQELEDRNKTLEKRLKNINEGFERSYNQFEKDPKVEIKKEQQKLDNEFNELAGKLKADEWVNKANALWIGNGYSDATLAISYFNKALELDPKSYIAYAGVSLNYYYMGEYNRALTYVNKALNINSSYAYGYNNRALIYLKFGKDDLALNDYNSAIKYDPNYALAYNNRGLLYYGKKEYYKALEDFNKSISLNPNYTESFYSRGLTYYFLGDHLKAIDDYTKAINANPNYSNAFLGRGLSYYYLDDFTSALRDYNSAIFTDPNNHVAYFDRGILYYKQGNMELARRDFLKTKEVMPSYNLGTYETLVTSAKESEAVNGKPFEISSIGQNYFKRGKDSLNGGKYYEAIELFDKVLWENPAYIDALINKGIAYENLGLDIEALRNFNLAIQIVPKDYIALFHRGKFYYKKRDYYNAEKDFKNALENKSDHIDSNIYLGLISKQNKNSNMALVYFDRAIAINPNDYWGYFEKGNVLQDQKKYNESIREYSNAISKKYNYKEAFINRGLSYEILGDYNNALSDYNQSLSLDPNYYLAYYNRGIVYYKQKNYPQALDDFQKTLSLKPDYSGAFGYIGDIYYNQKRYYEAISYYDKSLNYNSNDTYSLEFRGMSKISTGNNAGGCEDLKKACNLGRCDKYNQQKKRGICY